MKLSSEFIQREKHDKEFDGRFVAPEQAAAVERSELETLANTHREGIDVRAQSLSRTQGDNTHLEANWTTFFANADGRSKALHSGGFFGGKGWLW